MGAFTLHWIFLRCEDITNLLSIVCGPPSLWIKRASEGICGSGSVRERVVKVMIAGVWRRR